MPWVQCHDDCSHHSVKVSCSHWKSAISCCFLDLIELKSSVVLAFGTCPAGKHHDEILPF